MKPCALWMGAADKDGYGWCRENGERRAHRAALVRKLGRPIRRGYMALHTCDNPPCVEPDHLYEGTRADNDRDARERRRNGLKGARGDANGMRTHAGLSRGSRNAKAKLTENIVAEIKRCVFDGEVQQEVADRFGVSRPTISGIKSGKTWKHVAAAA
jgi:hypothetical protein